MSEWMAARRPPQELDGLTCSNCVLAGLRSRKSSTDFSAVFFTSVSNISKRWMCGQQRSESLYFLKLSAPLSCHLHRSGLPISTIIFSLSTSLPPSSNALLALPPTRPPTNTSEHAHACARALPKPLHLPEPQPTQPPPAFPLPAVFCPHHVKSASAPYHLSPRGAQTGFSSLFWN